MILRTSEYEISENKNASDIWGIAAIRTSQVIFRMHPKSNKEVIKTKMAAISQSLREKKVFFDTFNSNAVV